VYIFPYPPVSFIALFISQLLCSDEGSSGCRNISNLCQDKGCILTNLYNLLLYRFSLWIYSKTPVVLFDDRRTRHGTWWLTWSNCVVTCP